jgi:acetylornithine deacetylase/succinyl-diaminopimelate desuccinylase-like protein
MIDQVDQRLMAGHARAVASLCELLRIPSISTDPNHRDDVRAAAQWVAQYLSRIGLSAETWQTAGHPAVYGEWRGAGAGAPTVLVYGHHDVQPTGDLALWSSGPFEPTIKDDGRIVARGSADDKGQFFAQVLAAESWLGATAGLPLNLKFLIEGEEEIGSPNLGALLREKRERLTCDVVVVSDTPVWRPGQPTISLGTRGLMGLEVRVTGPNRDLHSGMYGGSVPNPIAVLARMLAALHDARGRVTVPGFYGDVREIDPQLRAEWTRLGFDDARESQQLVCGMDGEAGFSTLERRWARPTLEFNGITGGYQGPGSNTIVPSWASAKITCRMVPDQDASRLAEALQEHLRKLAPSSVRVEFLPRKVNSPAYSIEADHPGLRALARSFRHVYGVDPVRVREGLTLPILPQFKEVLCADTVLMGFCDPDCRAHSFDEFFHKDDLLRGARTAARFLDEYARVAAGER